MSFPRPLMFNFGYIKLTYFYKNSTNPVRCIDGDFGGSCPEMQQVKINQ